MEFPYGHHHHHHHHHRRDDDDDGDNEGRRQYYPPPGTDPPPSSLYHQQETAEFQPPPRPSGYYQEDQPEYPPPPTRPYYQQPEYAPPRTQETHVYHTSHDQEFDSSVDYMPPPTTQVTHVSHEQGDPAETHHSYRPHLPSFIHHHQSGRPESDLDLSNKPSYKIYSQAEPNHYLTIRDEKVVLATADPSDEYQHWYKDEKYSTRVKDEEGFPAFSLVNKVTGQAIKHSIGATHPVQLVPYNPDILDESVLWTESKDMGDGYRAVRMVNNIRLNVDAFHGDKKSGGVHDGTIIVLWQWNKGDNQRWKITPYCKFLDLV